MAKFNDAERKQAKRGLCVWQTASGMPWAEYCQAPAKKGHLCAEHERDARELYGVTNAQT